MNNEVNAFFEQRKLKLSASKCVQIHVGKKCGECETLYVNGEHMKEAQEFQYLGDLIGVEHGTIKGHTHVGFRHFEERKPVPVTTEERIAETDAGNQQHLEEDLNGKLQGVNEKASSLAIDFDPLDKISVEKDFDCKRTKSIPGKTSSIIGEDTEETNEKSLTDVLAEAEVFKVNLTLTVVPENEEQVANKY